MVNASYEINGDVLTIKIDLSKEHGPSKSGKTTLVSSSQGNQSILHKGTDFKIGLNVYKNRKA